MLNEVGTIAVQVVRTPNRAVAAVVPQGATVNDAIRESGVDASGRSIRVDGQVVDGSRALRNGDIIILAEQIKGN